MRLWGKNISLLVLVLILSFALRFFRVTEIPPSLNWDEVSIAYNAYSILQTGKDEWGKSFPLHFRAFGEYKLPVQIYASIPGIAAFGLNELGVRITPVVYGTLTILLVFLLAREIFKSVGIGLLSAFLLGISPWHIHLTRASFESSFAIFWIVLAIWLLVKALSSNNAWLLASMIAFAVSVYTYNSARVFVPIFLLVPALGFRKILLKSWKISFLSAVIFVSLMLPLLPSFISGEGGARYKLVSIADDPGLIPRINERRGHSTLPPPLPTLVHNKITYLTFYSVSHYLAHFTPDFLFISGAPHKQHHVQGMGELYLFQAPFLILGLFLLFRSKQKFRWLITLWIVLGLIPVSLTNDSIPHALRTLIVAPAYQLITAFGLWRFLRYLQEHHPRWVASFEITMIIILGVSLAYYLHLYYQLYPRLYSRDWQYGYKQVVEYIKTHRGDYDEIVFTRHFGEPHIFTLFFLNYDPAKYQNNPNLVRFETNDWVWVLKFDKFFFPDLGDPGTKYSDIVSQKGDKKMLFIGKEGDFPPNLPRLAKIDFLNGQTAFEIIESK